jgi:hypothetical protein
MAGDAPLDWINRQGSLRRDALTRAGRGNLPFARNIAGQGVCQQQDGTVLPPPASTVAKSFVGCFLTGQSASYASNSANTPLTFRTPPNNDLNDYGPIYDTGPFLGADKSSIITLPNTGYYLASFSLQVNPISGSFTIGTSCILALVGPALWIASGTNYVDSSKNVDTISCSAPFQGTAGEQLGLYVTNSLGQSINGEFVCLGITQIG